MNEILKQMRGIIETAAACLSLVVIWKIIAILSAIIDSMGKTSVAR
jgi:hypothetical protein